LKSSISTLETHYFHIQQLSPQYHKFDRRETRVKHFSDTQLNIGVGRCRSRRVHYSIRLLPACLTSLLHHQSSIVSSCSCSLIYCLSLLVFEAYHFLTPTSLSTSEPLLNLPQHSSLEPRKYEIERVLRCCRRCARRHRRCSIPQLPRTFCIWFLLVAR